ncbi:MAG: hypothetical protein Crog4KO_25870 [Crocinitomicaceae bacterium]
MDKAMKTFLIIILTLTTYFSNAQDWITLSNQDYGEIAGTSWWGLHTGSYRGFGISPNDNSIWMLRGNRLTVIDSDGNYTKTEFSNHPVLPEGDYYDFAFVGSETFLVDAWSGLYSYDGTTWSLQQNFAWGEDMHVDNDTILIGITSQNPSAIYTTSGTFQYQAFDADRVRRKNNVTWYWTGGNIIYRYYSGVYGTPHVADTSLRLDNSLNDFKFSPTSDSLFLAGDLGISIANSTHFVDSITPLNSINMPNGTIEQFEFDALGNIWAVFGQGFDHVSIGYLDRSTMVWTSVYDESNSPIDFPNTKVAIELDSYGNLWVSESQELHRLAIGTGDMVWLNTDELEKKMIEIFPNPSNGNISIEFDPSIKVETIEILDYSGRVIKSLKFEESINVDLDQGSYLIQLKNGDTILASEKHVIN